jgi:phage regulator Rha-like protein
MSKTTTLLPQKEIENRIFTLRNLQVMIDRDLAEMYGVETKVLNQAVKRNIERFPASFRFQITEDELNNLSRSQIVTLNSDNKNEKINRGQNIKYLPYAFTEQGVAMLSAVLKSETAVKVSIQIIDAFVEMRKMILGNSGLFQRLDKVETKQIEADQKFEQIFKALENKDQQPEKGIFFEGQIYDAYTFIADIIKKAEKSLVIIDNFIDETVLTLLTKRKKTVVATIYTKQISKQLQLDLKKHNEQYPAIDIKILDNSHDRFLIIDEQKLYHIGASLKDLGKKWFAFSKMDSFTNEVLTKLK